LREKVAARPDEGIISNGPLTLALSLKGRGDQVRRVSKYKQ